MHPLSEEELLRRLLAAGGAHSYSAAFPIAIRFPAHESLSDFFEEMEEVAERMLQDERDHRLEASRRELEKLEEKPASINLKMSSMDARDFLGQPMTDKPRVRPYEAQMLVFDLVELSDEELAQAKAEGRYTAIEDPE